MAILKYVGTVINNINGFKQSTRPKNVGQLSDMIQEYKDTTVTPSKEGWVEYYEGKQSGSIAAATDKTWEGIQELIENLQSLTKEDVRSWTEDLVIDKTFDGLFWQEEILKQLQSKKISWRCHLDTVSELRWVRALSEAASC